MSTIYLEGFDKYGLVGQNNPTLNTLLTQQYNDVQNASSTITLVNGLSSGGGKALSVFGNGRYVGKTLAGNYSRIIGGFRFQSDLTTSGNAGIVFLDGSSAQFSITINPTTGTISIKSGSETGTVIATSSASVTANSIHYLEWDVTIGTSAAYTVYLDGTSVVTGSTGNTRAGTSNSQVNAFRMGVMSGANTTIVFDDMYLFDTSGSVNVAALRNNPRIETRYPTGDSQTQWTNNGNTIIPTGVVASAVSNTTTSVNAPGSAILALIKITPAVSCTLQSVGILPQTTSATAKFKAVLYSDSSGSPNTLTATGSEVTATTAATALTLPFSSGQSLTGGTSYWIGFIGDTSINLAEYETSTTLGQKKANTYASGAPSPATGMTTGQASWMIWGNATGATVNWESVNHNPADGVGPAADNGTIKSSTVSNEDLYSFASLSSSVAAVYSIALAASVKRSDAGARTIDLRLKSSTTDSGGSVTGISPGTSYGWTASYFDTDPNGGGAWTVSGANASTSGPKVAS